MEKVINGQLIDIGDIRLFELGLEGLSINKVAINNINIELKDDENINKCIEIYNQAYRKLPFPLYSIETNLKYSCIANLMKEQLKFDCKLWVNKCLCIYIVDSKLLVKFIGNTWCIEYVEEPYKDNTDLDLYKKDVGYAEFSWILENKDKDGLALEFYQEFMSDLLRACGNNANIMVKEFSKILDFEVVPEQVKIKDNHILDCSFQDEYYVDIYCNELLETKTEQYSIDLTEDNSEITSEVALEPVYSLDVYKKTQLKDGRLDSLGALEIDEDLSDKLYNVLDIEVDTELKGVKIGNLIFLEINDTITYLNLLNNKYSRVGTGISIYSFNINCMYFLRQQLIRDKTYKNIIYKYNLSNGNISIAKITFS